MSGTLQMVDTPAKRFSARGVFYEGKFYYEGDDPEEVMPKIGDKDLTWGPSGKSNRVTECKADPLGTSAYMVYITITTEDEEGGSSGGNSKEELGKKVERQMSLKELVMQPKWWGVMMADKSIAGLQAFKSFESKKDKNKQYDYYYAYYNIFQTAGVEKYCVEGDYVYKNANPKFRIVATDKSKEPSDHDYQTESINELRKNPDDGTFTGTVGTPNTTLSPYTGLDANNVGYAGQKVKTMVYRVTFYRRVAFNTIPTFCGINGTFGPGCAPFDTTEKTWLALDQTVEKVTDSDGDIWSKVTRTMERVPFGFALSALRWDENKAQYGTWTW